MAIVVTNLETTQNDVNQNSYNTGSVTPASNALILVTVLSRATAGTTNAPTLTGNSLTYVQVVTKIASDNTNHITTFRALGASPTAGAITIDFAGQTQLYCHWSIAQLTGTDTTGTNGSGAIVQTGSNEDDGATNTGLLITLSAFGSANNVGYGGVRAGNVVTPGSGFTEIGQTSGEAIMETEYKLNDNTVDWSWTSTSSFAIGVACEVAVAVAITTSSNLTILNAG